MSLPHELSLNKPTPHTALFCARGLLGVQPPVSGLKHYHTLLVYCSSYLPDHLFFMKCTSAITSLKENVKHYTYSFMEFVAYCEYTAIIRNVSDSAISKQLATPVSSSFLT